MPAKADLLIRNAEINDVSGQDVLVQAGHIVSIASSIPAPTGIQVMDAVGGALLPGLKDHHLHLAATAVAKESLRCGPNDWSSAEEFAAALQDFAARSDGEWLRGIAYHDSVAGDIDAAWLDRYVADKPVRIQHRGGRQWVFNTAALQWLGVGEGDPFERVNGALTGRLLEGDAWLRKRMQDLGQGGFPSLKRLSRELASYGITAVTDTSPDNNRQTLQHFEQAMRSGDFVQELRLMGSASLDGVQSELPGLQIGPRKFHLLESALPDLEQVIAAIESSHAAGRNVAFHCVTRTELIFALTALEQAEVLPGDRIEHASITPPEALEKIQQLGLTVVSQPALVSERGDQYLTDVDVDDQVWLYRLKAFLKAGVPLAGSSDAPYTDVNPWRAMQAAVDRGTKQGAVIGAEEALTPEQALALYTSPLASPGLNHAEFREGMLLDCCLLAQPWKQVSAALSRAQVQLCVGAGRLLFSAHSQA